jgi:hypothetical protein
LISALIEATIFILQCGTKNRVFLWGIEIWSKVAAVAVGMTGVKDEKDNIVDWLRAVQ